MSTKKKFAMILSGCGGLDGSESHEAISLMIAMKQIGVNYICFAINEDQKYVIHAVDRGVDSSHDDEKRNMLTEARRLNHGVVHDLKKLTVDSLDALILPGGYGTGTSLSNFVICDNGVCSKNSNYRVRKEIKDIICEFYRQKKPIFAGCMAPVLVNGSLTGVKIMTDIGGYTKEIIENYGNSYQICKAGDICVDKKNKIVTAPFYMTPKVEVDTIFKESVKGIKEIVKMCSENLD